MTGLRQRILKLKSVGSAFALEVNAELSKTIAEIKDMKQHDHKGFSAKLRHQIWGYNEALDKVLSALDNPKPEEYPGQRYHEHMVKVNTTMRRKA